MNATVESTAVNGFTDVCESSAVAQESLPPEERTPVTARAGAPLVISVLGEVDAVSAGELRDQVTEIVSARPGDVIVDVSHVRLLAAAGVRVLADLADQLTGAGHRMHVVAGDGPVARALRHATVSGAVDISPTLGTAAATALVAGPAGPAADPPEQQHALVELGELTVACQGLRQALTRLAELACQAIPGVDGASVGLGPPTGPDLLAWSSARAQCADGAQLAAGAGPTFDAYEQVLPVATADVVTDHRWPRLGDALLQVRVTLHSCLAVPLRQRAPGGEVGTVGTLGVLTLYSRDSWTLQTPAARQQAERFAARATGITTVARRFSDLARTHDQLTAALTSRATIDQAKGVIMADKGCGPEEAFAILRQISSVTNRKVRDVAREVVDRASR
jgi:anti-anti-sigma factor